MHRLAALVLVCAPAIASADQRVTQWGPPIASHLVVGASFGVGILQPPRDWWSGTDATQRAVPETGVEAWWEDEPPAQTTMVERYTVWLAPEVSLHAVGSRWRALGGMRLSLASTERRGRGRYGAGWLTVRAGAIAGGTSPVGSIDLGGRSPISPHISVGFTVGFAGARAACGRRATRRRRHTVASEPPRRFKVR